jgi:hypothetical protein
MRVGSNGVAGKGTSALERFPDDTNAIGRGDRPQIDPRSARMPFYTGTVP